MFVWTSILLLQGTIASFACGCGLEDICRDGGIMSRTVDPFSDIQESARCSGPDASSSSWYIRRYMNGNASPDGLGAPLTLNDSFRRNGNELTIREVNGFAEGTYHCGVDNSTIQPASLCLFVRGQPVFSHFDDNASIAATMNANVSIDTRIKFVDGGFCNMTKNIRTLTVRKDGEQVYLCSNLITFSTQLCTSKGRFGVEHQQTCIEPNVTLCKYDMKLVLLDFRESDIGVYNVTMEFENDGNGRGMLTRQFNITLSKGLPNDTFSTSTFTTTFVTTTTDLGGGISSGGIAGLVIGVIVLIVGISTLLIIIIILVEVRRDKRRDETLGNIPSPTMLAMTDDKIIIVGDDSAGHVKIFSKDRKKLKSFKLRGEKKPYPRGVSTDGTYIFITDRANQSITKYTFNGVLVKSVGGINGNCGVSINQRLGRVYIADQENSMIQVLDMDLEPIETFGRNGKGEEEFDKPRDVAVVDDGTVYVTDTNNNRIQVLDTNGRFRQFGNDRLHSPMGICVDSSNRVLVADHHPYNRKIYAFNLQGEYLSSLDVNEDGEEFTDLIGIAVDSDRKIYSADYGGNCVHVIENF